ncbi:MAG: iron chelate uptake ABC transporter family permease subunit [Hyphomonadaceae bacterium]
MTLGSVEARSLEHVAIAGGLLIAGGALHLSRRARLASADAGRRGGCRDWLPWPHAHACTSAPLPVRGATAVAGVIGFVGIAAPHLVRAIAGHDPARLLLPSAFAGGYHPDAGRHCRACRQIRN